MDEVLWHADKRYSQITEKYPDPKLFPLYYKAKRYEYILRPGEMLFIPTGWFHFVFSDEPDTETGLCVAFNIWHGKQENRDDSDKSPKIEWHSINSKEFLEKFKNLGKVSCVKSSSGYFPPRQFHFRYPFMKEIFITFEEFLYAKNSEQYMMSPLGNAFDKFIPENIVNDENTQCYTWINWGNCNTLPHYDGQDNWLCQILGKRRVILFPQSERDKLYLFNSYPLKLINDIHSKYKKKDTIIHKESSTLNTTVIQELSSHLQENNEVFVECDSCETSFKKEIKEMNKCLKSSHCKTIPEDINAHIFQISKCKRNEEIISEFPICVIWCLTETKLKIKDVEIELKPGDTLSCPGSFLYPIYILKECVLIKPKNM